jgi:hypothetical protein
MPADRRRVGLDGSQRPNILRAMVRRDETDHESRSDEGAVSRCTSPADERSARVIAGAPGSRPQSSGRDSGARAGRRKPVRRRESRDGEQERGLQHEVKPAASSKVQTESRAAHVWERSRKRIYFLQRWPSERSMKRVRARVKELTPNSRCHEDMRDVIASLNPVLRGWSNTSAPAMPRSSSCRSIAMSSIGCERCGSNAKVVTCDPARLAVDA